MKKWEHNVRNFHVVKKKEFWKLVRNPLYMGKIIVKAFKLEPAQMVQGLHIPIISEALFYRTQEFLDGRRRYQVVSIAAPEKFPLRGSLVCDKDGRLLTASSSRGRKHYYDYYHCSSQCGVRFKAELVNKAMLEELIKYKPHRAVKELYRLVLKDIDSRVNSERSKMIKDLKDEIIRLGNRQGKARELMMSDNIDPDDFRTIKKECELGIIQAEEQLGNISSRTNLEPLIDKSVEFLENIDSFYVNGDAKIKRNIVGSMFPEKLQFDGERFRTTRVNEAATLIFNIDGAFSQKERGQKQEYSSLSSWG